MSVMRELPKSLQKFLAKHPEKFSDGWSEKDGSNEADPYNGWSHWIYLKPGWCYPEPGAHIIHEDTVKIVKRCFRDVEPCTCSDCQPEGKHK